MLRRMMLLSAALLLSSVTFLTPPSAQAANICSCAFCLDNAFATCYGAGRVEVYCSDYFWMYCQVGG